METPEVLLTNSDQTQVIIASDMDISASILILLSSYRSKMDVKRAPVGGWGGGGLSGLFLFSLNSKLGFLAPFDLKFSSLDLMQHELLKKNIIKR